MSPNIARQVPTRVRQSRAPGGFTLLEVLIALVILSVGVMAAMQLFPVSMRLVHDAVARTAAANLATSEMSRLRALGSVNAFKRWADRSVLDANASTAMMYNLYGPWRSTIQCMSGADSLYRVTFTVKMDRGRYETYVTYVTRR